MSESAACEVEDCYKIVPNNSLTLKLITQNIVSISKNFPAFLTLLTRTNTNWDIIVLTECRLMTTSNLPSLDGYNVIGSKNNFTQNEGVVFYIKDNLVYTIEEPRFLDANCLLLKIGNSTAVIGIYRPPAYRNISNFLNSLDEILSKIKGFNNIILTGDININIGDNVFNADKNDYLMLMASHGLFPAHTLPTRLRNCLDHVLLKTKLPASTLVAHSALTDHEVVLFYLTVKLPKTKQALQYAKVDYVAIDKTLKDTNFDLIYTFNDANLAAQYLVQLLMSMIQQHSSTRKSTNRKKILKPWITPGLLRCMRHRDRLHKKTKLSPDDSTLKLVYVRYRNYCNRLLKQVKSDYEKKELTNAGTNNKQLWKAINNITHRNRSNRSASSIITKNFSLNDVNNFFVNIGKTLAENNLNNISPHCNQSLCLTAPPLHSFVLLPTDETEISSIINSLKSGSTVGWDSISCDFLKIFKCYLTAPLTYICNLALASGTFPKVFKKSIIHPIYKSGDRASVNNYRPISILPSLSKVLEKLLNIRLVKYLESNNILSPSQFGFRANLSTSDAVHNLTNFIVENLDDKKKVVGIFLDLAKAFDTVSVPRLVDKLESTGIRGIQLNLFKDYLTDRTQCVMIDGNISEETPIQYGVPQGSILGPTLFLIFINDLCNLNLNGGKLIAFADDTSLLFSADSWQETFALAQSGFDTVSSWLRDNLLTLNIAKTKYITFALREPKHIASSMTIKVHSHSCKLAPNTICNCSSLEEVHVIKYLGILIDSNLNFQPHIKLLTDRLRKLIFVFKNLRHVANHKILTTVYFALCQSLIMYCIISWGGAVKSFLIKLERAQRSILKVMHFLPYKYPTVELYRRSRVLTVRQLFVLGVVIKQHSIYPYDPHAISKKRRKDFICVNNKIYSTSFSQRFFCFLGCVLYNKINKEIYIYHDSIKSCKDKVKKWLLELSYDDTEKLITF